jgi:hypothetical protein
MEFLIAKSVEAARDRGDDMLSLSLSALAKVDPDEGRSVPATAAEGADRLRAFLLDHLSRFYDFQGLFHWKKKFSPSSRTGISFGDAFAPRGSLALARAQSPEDSELLQGTRRPGHAFIPSGE